MFSAFRYAATPLFLTLTFLFAGPVAAKEGRSANPSLSAEVDGIKQEGNESDALRFDDFDLNIRSHGAVAEGELTATIANPGEDELEALFEFQMPPGAVVTGYAIDLEDPDEEAEGLLIDGVLLEKKKAKAAYENQVRGEIDPGLANVSREGLFSTYIYPVEEQGTRRLRLRFTFPIGAGLALPLKFREKAKRWTIRLEMAGLDKEPDISLMGKSSIDRKAARYISSVEGANSAIDGMIKLSAIDIPEVLISKHENRKEFVHLSGKLPRSANKGERPQLMRIYWDNSLSRRQGNVELEQQLAVQLAESLAPRSVELVRFNSEAARVFPLADGAALNTQLNAVGYIGGSSFAALPQQDDLQKADLCLLFFDGIITVDRKAEFDPDCPLHVISSVAGANATLLSALARDHGGRFHALKSAAAAPTIISSIGQDEPVIQSIRGNNGRARAFITLPAPPGRWAAVVKSQSDRMLNVRLGSAARSYRRDIPLYAEAKKYNGAGALWAHDQLARREGDLDRAGFLEFARDYSVEVPSLSFLVLEEPDDYVNNDIAPPASYPKEMMAKYAEYRADADKEEKQEREERFDDLLDDWDELKEWWADEYEFPKEDYDEDGSVANIAPAPPAPAGSVSDAAADAVDEEAAPAAVEEEPSFPGGRGAYSGGDAVIIVTATKIDNSIGVTIDAWQPDRPYITALDAAPNNFDVVFRAQEKEYGKLPAFYLDVARWLDARGDRDRAVETILSALELPVANDETSLIVAQRLQRYGQIDRAVELLEYLAATQPDLPQPGRHLALALINRAKIATPAGKKSDYGRALDLLYNIAINPVRSGDEGIDLIALVEANAILAKAKAAGAKNPLDKRLVALLDADIRVVYDWTTESTDLDLWVIEPTKEKAYYGNQLTEIGGHMSDDMTDGYGPEEYMIRRAMPGTYAVRAHVYSSDRINPNGVSILTARLIRNFGRDNQSEEYVDIELRGEDDDDKKVGTVTVGKK